MANKTSARRLLWLTTTCLSLSLSDVSAQELYLPPPGPPSGLLTPAPDRRNVVPAMPAAYNPNTQPVSVYEGPVAFDRPVPASPPVPAPAPTPVSPVVQEVTSAAPVADYKSAVPVEKAIPGVRPLIESAKGRQKRVRSTRKYLPKSAYHTRRKLQHDRFRPRTYSQKSEVEPLFTQQQVDEILRNRAVAATPPPAPETSEQATATDTEKPMEMAALPPRPAVQEVTRQSAPAPMREPAYRTVQPAPRDYRDDLIKRAYVKPGMRRASYVNTLPNVALGPVKPLYPKRSLVDGDGVGILNPPMRIASAQPAAVAISSPAVIAPPLSAQDAMAPTVGGPNQFADAPMRSHELHTAMATSQQVPNMPPAMTAPMPQAEQILAEFDSPAQPVIAGGPDQFASAPARSQELQTAMVSSQYIPERPSIDLAAPDMSAGMPTLPLPGELPAASVKVSTDMPDALAPIMVSEDEPPLLAAPAPLPASEALAALDNDTDFPDTLPEVRQYATLETHRELPVTPEMFELPVPAALREEHMMEEVKTIDEPSTILPDISELDDPPTFTMAALDDQPEISEIPDAPDEPIMMHIPDVSAPRGLVDPFAPVEPTVIMTPMPESASSIDAAEEVEMAGWFESLSEMESEQEDAPKSLMEPMDANKPDDMDDENDAPLSAADAIEEPPFFGNWFGSDDDETQDEVEEEVASELPPPQDTIEAGVEMVDDPDAPFNGNPSAFSILEDGEDTFVEEVTLDVPTPKDLAEQKALSDMPELAAVKPKDKTLHPSTREILNNLPSRGGKRTLGTQSFSVERLDPEIENILNAEPTETDDVRKVESGGMSVKVKRPAFNATTELEKAYNLLLAGETSMAVEIYKDVLRHNPNDQTALFGLATTFHRVGEIGKARPLYGKLLMLNPDHRDALNNFLVLVSEEAPEEGLQQLKTLQAKYPTYSQIPAQMAIVYDQLGYPDLAKRAMLRAVNLSPENLVYKYNLAVMLDSQGALHEAASLYRQLIKAGQRGERLPTSVDDLQQRLSFIVTHRLK